MYRKHFHSCGVMMKLQDSSEYDIIFNSWMVLPLHPASFRFCSISAFDPKFIYPLSPHCIPIFMRSLNSFLHSVSCSHCVLSGQSARTHRHENDSSQNRKPCSSFDTDAPEKKIGMVFSLSVGCQPANLRFAYFLLYIIACTKSIAKCKAVGTKISLLLYVIKHIRR